MLFHLEMKAVKTLLATFSVVCWLVRGGIIHLDVTNNGDVTVEIDSESRDLQSESHRIEGDDNPQSQVETQPVIYDQYDVDLPYEVHRGFLSVSLTLNIRWKLSPKRYRMIVAT